MLGGYLKKMITNNMTPEILSPIFYVVVKNNFRNFGSWLIEKRRFKTIIKNSDGNIRRMVYYLEREKKFG